MYKASFQSFWRCGVKGLEHKSSSESFVFCVPGMNIFPGIYLDKQLQGNVYSQRLLFSSLTDCCTNDDTKGKQSSARLALNRKLS